MMQLKVYRKDNRKKDQRRWRRLVLRIAGFVCLGGILIAAYQLREPIVLSAASSRDFILESSYFSVREIQVRG
ncbi:MAG TPA: hypothetical protein VFN20_01635, partial [Candidatus Acidoferrum sp.]|nr:hypothetical protein [Candidatus Acidoferrum sp.]